MHGNPEHATSESPAKVVRHFLAALDGEDVEAALTWLDEDVYFVTSGNEACRSSGDFSGHEGFRRWWELEKERRKYVLPLRLEPLDATHVFAEVHIGTACGPATWLSVGIGLVTTIHDGRIQALETFTDPEQALARLRMAAPEVTPALREKQR